MCIQYLVEFCPFILKILSKNQILALIKCHNYVTNLRSTTIYNTNIDLVNDDVYTNLVSFCQFVLKTLSKDQNLTSIKGRNPVANWRKTMIYISLKVDRVNANEYTKFGLILSIHSQDIE